MNFQLVTSDQSSFSEPTANFRALIALKLKDFAVFRMFNHGPIASKFLREKHVTEMAEIHRENSTFLQALTIFFKSYSAESPWMVVNVFRPFLCWIRMWTRPSWTPLSSPLAASAKGSGMGRKNRFNRGTLLEASNWHSTKMCHHPEVENNTFCGTSF